MSPQSSARPGGPARRTPPRRPSARRQSAAVYWRRRAIVFGMPLVLLVAVIVMFSGGGSKPQSAALAGKTTPTTQPRPRPSQAPDPAAVATGACTPSSIQVTPSVPAGVAGGVIAMHLTFTTTEPACTFAMSGSTVAVKILSGTKPLWTSQDCPRTVPGGSLTLRAAAPQDVLLNWDGHQSNGNCGATNPWVGPGTYTALASVIGATPTRADFSLTLPTPKTITKTASPSPQPSTTAKPSATAKPTAKATAKPTKKA